MKECTVVHRRVGDTIDVVEQSHSKLERIDKELQGQLKIIRMLVVQLENKRLDTQLLFDKVLNASHCQDNLQNILSSLSKSQVNQSIIKQSSSDDASVENKLSLQQVNSLQLNLSQQQQINKQSDQDSRMSDQNMSGMQQQQYQSQDKKSEISRTGSFPQPSAPLKIQTLCDFVDDDSISEITSKAELAFASLKSLKDKCIEVTENLIRKIDIQVSTIHKSKNDLDYQYTVLREKFTKLKTLIIEVHKMFTTVEMIYKKVNDTRVEMSSEQITKIQAALSSILGQSKQHQEDINMLFDTFKTCNDQYDEFYENSRIAYVNFVNFAPSVQIQMQDVDKWHSQYEIRRLQCLEDYEEIEKLATWYEFFKQSYQQFEKELLRRKAYDQAIQSKVDLMRTYLLKELEQEQSQRLDFNDQHYRYLPMNLRQLLEDPPTRYEIYPKHIIIDDDLQRSGLIHSQQPTQTMNSDQLIEFLGEWKASHQNAMLNSDQQNSQDSLQDHTHEKQQQHMMGESVVHDDYFQKNPSIQEQLGQNSNKKRNLVLDEENFVSLENENFQQFAQDRVEYVRTNTSTKTYEEDKKMQ